MPANAGSGWDSAAIEQVLQEPYAYITQVPGKDVRSYLIDAFNLWMNVPDEKLEVIKDVTKKLHNASLLIDDIQDGSTLRRGIPVAHSVYGVATTINSANYIYFQCMERVIAMGEPGATAAFTEQLLELHRGQGMDIHWRDSGVCPSMDEYKEMVTRKTGGLFGLALRLMQLFSPDTADYAPLLRTLGLHFQIRDDYANLISDEYAQNKTFAEDFTEGKFSYPIIHAIRADPEDRQVINILRKRTRDENLKRFAVSCIERAGSLVHTREVLRELEATARAEIEGLGGNAALHAFFDKLSTIYQMPAE